MKIIEIPEGKSAEWQNVDGKTILVLVDEKPKSVIERVKTFDDAIKELGENHPLYKDYLKVKDCSKDIVAFAKLRIIAAALNEGWTPKFTTDEYRYYPWLHLWTQEEINKMSEENKQKLLIVGAVAYGGAQCGIGSSPSYGGFSNSDISLSARLAFKNRELAKYCGIQFIDIWADYVYVYV